MSFYKPLYIAQYETGLVQSRQDFLLPNDAYPILLNAYVWREKILKKPGCILLGRLRRVLTTQALGALDGGGNFTGNIRTAFFPTEVNASLEVGSVTVTDGVNTWIDNGLGVLKIGATPSGTINYTTMDITLTGGVPTNAITASFNYYPTLPVMGLRQRELDGTSIEQMVAFDTKYAYFTTSINGFQEFIPGTTWTGTDADFFWSTNYWVSKNNSKIFWVSNFVDPIRYTDGPGGSWIDFSPNLSDPTLPIINPNPDVLWNALILIPFRGRLVAFNTFEGKKLAGRPGTHFRQRIRWAAIGNPFDTGSAIVTDVNKDAWRDDIQGQGGFLDIPTAEDITAVGFVRDNVVIYCEKSTWQLRYTGKSIAPFQVEKINSELGAESTFSAVQFDTSLLGIGDKGVVECNSFKSEKIDEKIPDLVFSFKNDQEAIARVQGIRDIQQKLVYWTYVASNTTLKFPNRRLVYNYENESWAIFIDCYTALGYYFQTSSGLRWQDFPGPDPGDQWQSQNFAWIGRPAGFPEIAGGNQQGYVELLGQNNFNIASVNDISLYIKEITGFTTTSTVLTVVNNNLEDNQIIKIVGIPTGTPFSNLNNGVFRISVDPLDSTKLALWKYNSVSGQFNTPQTDAPPLTPYIGGGNIVVRDNFNVVSKQFNFVDQGQSVQFGFMDVTFATTEAGALTLNIYKDYDLTTPINIYPENVVVPTNAEDPFFNKTISTSTPTYSNGDKLINRIYCNCRGNYITLEFTLSNAQMAGIEAEEYVEIDNQILYMRPAGRQLTARF